MRVNSGRTATLDRNIRGYRKTGPEMGLPDPVSVFLIHTRDTDRTRSGPVRSGQKTGPEFELFSGETGKLDLKNNSIPVVPKMGLNL